MDLPLDPRLPLGGIALILALVWLTGGRRRARIADADAARAVLSQPELGFIPARISVAADGAAAIAADTAGRLGLVFPVGAKLAARVLLPADLTERTLEPAAAAGPARLCLATKGPAALRLALILPLAEAQSWLERLES